MKKNNLQNFPTNLLIVFILLMLLTITISIYYFNSYEKKHRTEVDKQLIAITELKVNEIEQWRNERINDAKLFYNNKHIQNLISTFLNDTNNLQTIDYIKRMFDYVMLNNEYCKMLIVDSLGNEILTYPKNKGNEKSSHKNDISKVKYSGNIYFKDLFKDYNNDSIHLEMVVPIMNNDNHLIAAIELCINPNKYLFPLIKFWPTDSKSAETILVRRENDSILYINNLKFRKNSELKLKVSLNNNNIPAVMAVRGKEGIVDGVDYRDIPVVAYIKPIKGTPWFIVSQIDNIEVYAPMRERRWEIIIFVLFIIAGFCLILIFLWRKQQYNQQKQNYQSVMALLESEKRYKTIFEGAGEGIMYHLPNGKILECNNAFANMHGYTQKEMIGKTLQEINNPESSKKIEYRINEVLNNGKHFFEIEHIHKNGTTISIEATSGLFIVKGEKIIVSFQRDISERKIVENKIKKLNRIYALISNINKAIVRVKNINELYNNVCKIATEIGEFKMAWIGELNQNTNKVDVINFAGTTGNYLNLINIDLNDEARSNGPTAKAIKTGFYSFSNNLQNDNSMLPWINEAKKLGFNSSIALPIIVFDKTIGTLNLYSSEINFFDQQEINLLIEVSNDISFAIEYLKKEVIHKKTETELVKSEAKYRLIANNSSDIIWTLDLKTLKFTYRSPSFEKILGYTQEETEDFSFSKYFSPETYAFLIDEINKSLEQYSNKQMEPDEVKIYELQEYCKNGSLIDVEIRAKFILDKNATPIGIQGITSDITKRKIVEKKLIESEQLLSESQKIAQLGSYSLNINTGIWTSSKILDNIFGIDNNYIKNIDNWANLIYKEDKEIMLDYITNEVIAKHNNFNKEYRIVRQNDNEIRWVHGLGELEINEKDNLTKMFGTITDITERKIAEDELQKSQELFKTLTTVTQVGIFQTSANGLTTYVNPKWTELTGLTIEEAQGNGWLNAVHPDDREKLQKNWSNNNILENSSIAEYRFLRKDNNIVWVLGNAIPYFKDKKIQGYIGAITDITQQKQIEKDINELNQNLEQRVVDRTKQLQSANNELEAFSYSVSHDLRSPLRIIQGFSKAINQQYKNDIDENGKHLLKVIFDNTIYMETLINSLLNISRTTFVELRKIKVNMNIILNIVINETTTPEKLNQYKITINNLPESNADAELIKQVWINLFSNAVKYTSTKKEKTIEIGGWEEINENIYYIKDNGVGFNSEYSSKLFKVFQRLHSSKDFEGTGVGLAIVSRIISKHGGKVWAESKINESATFWFSLPK